MAESLLSAWSLARKRLGDVKGIETPTFEARLFVEAATGATRMDILTDPYREISYDAYATLSEMLARREAREPASHILGYKDFWTLRLGVSSAVLTPRPETELVVKTALEMMKPDARILDLGAGSGAILLSLLSEKPESRGVGVDKSAEALVLARANGAALGLQDRVEWREGEWGAGLDGPFDLIVSNPPYIKTATIGSLEPEVAEYEPHLALDGGVDGLDAYRAILPQIHGLLAEDGIWAVEIGQGQADVVWAYADKAGLRPLGVKEDLAGIPRVVFGRR